MSKSFRRYLTAKQRAAIRRNQRRAHQRFSVERLEKRINPSVTASISVGVLTVASDAASDNFLISDIDGNGSVDVDDLNTVGIDFANLGAISGLTGISVTGGDGSDTIVLQGTDSLGQNDLASVAYTVGGGNGAD